MHPTALHPPASPALWALDFGARPLAHGGTRFRVWAPRAQRVEVVFPKRKGFAAPLEVSGDGEFSATLPDAPPGTDYGYRLDGGRMLPDPVSRWQPGGVHGPSRLLDPAAFPWTDAAWRGLPLEALVTYELHVGTFTPAGTFDAAIERLDYLCELGVTAIEPMPIAEFPGGRNWGYDGVHLYAPQSTYGGPEAFKRLVDACHARGLGVILDVVYNHLGPEGNYLGEYGPYFSGRYRTPWGDALNFDDRDCEPVRRHFIDNALYWLTEYHVDGLRLDAIHGIFDFGAKHLLAMLREAFHAQAARLGRQAWLIAESDLNDTRVVDSPAAGGWALDAQWSDDFHHAQHTLLTGARQGYFADFGRVAHLTQALERTFVYDGAWSPYRRRRHGNSAAGRPGKRFCIAVQNHDQIANASGGLRLGQLSDPEREKLAAALLLCAPNLPLLFMGQEFAARTPFHYFTSHGDAELAQAVTAGRRREHASFEGTAAFMEPQAQATFDACRLDWACLDQAPHAGVLTWYRDLLALRRAQPCLHDCDASHTRAVGHEAARWLVLQRGGLEPSAEHAGSAALLAANYAPQAVPVPVPAFGQNWRRVLWSGDRTYGGPGGTTNAPAPPLTLENLPRGELPLGAWQAVLYLRENHPDT